LALGFEVVISDRSHPKESNLVASGSKGRREFVRDGVSAPRLSGDARQRELVMAAYDLLAKRGFEGLRTRDVADRVGINVATLHYHFPSKEDLIRAVLEFHPEIYAADPAPLLDEPKDEVLRALRQEFENSRYWKRERPEILTVTREFALRSLRDPVLRDVIGRNNAKWHASVEQILARGVASGVFRSDLDVSACATVLTGFLWGAGGFLDVDATSFEAACVEFERLVLSPKGRRAIAQSESRT
jgi:AcrR family transcriptional regulator